MRATALNTSVCSLFVALSEQSQSSQQQRLCPTGRFAAVTCSAAVCRSVRERQPTGWLAGRRRMDRSSRAFAFDGFRASSRRGYSYGGAAQEAVFVVRLGRCRQHAKRV
uniref:Secreted protein n=1 Tax=Plectus sambesii TaxID=2011161 RepID=A0A914V6U2_9BILA